MYRFIYTAHYTTIRKQVNELDKFVSYFNEIFELSKVEEELNV